MKKEDFKTLFAGFPEVSPAAWEDKIRADLKGADVEKKLVWKTEEGIDVRPYYRKEDLASLGYLEKVGQLRLTGHAPNSWIICQDIYPGRDTEEANQQVRTALKGGAQALHIHLSNCPLTDIQILDSVLDGIPLGETEIHFEGCLNADALYEMYIRLASARGVSSLHLRGSLGADPLGKMIRLGIPVASLENLVKLVRKASEASPDFRVIGVNGALLQNAGSTLVEELALAMSMASEYMDILIKHGIKPDLAQNTLQLSLAAGSNYFMEIAKLRAARILWAKIAEAYGVDQANRKIRIHSISSEWNMTLYDPYVNILRGTTEAMSSIIGGTDMLSVLPFDYPYGKTTEFSRRIARNIQIILREEACFDRVSDPAAGSYYIENLTDSLGEKAWELFREVESRGGFRKACESEWIQEQILDSREKKIRKISSGQERLLGTNAYPNFNEAILKAYEEKEAEDEIEGTFAPLHPFRISSLFEEVRLQTERSSKRPRVLLFKYGNPAWATARAAFSGNFFACGGYEILDPPAFSSIEQGIQTVRDSDADVVVLCSSDDGYVDLAPAVGRQLAGEALLVIAGNPTEAVDSVKKAGIDHFIHMKSNLLETLQEYNSILL